MKSCNKHRKFLWLKLSFNIESKFSYCVMNTTDINILRTYKFSPCCKWKKKWNFGFCKVQATGCLFCTVSNCLFRLFRQQRSLSCICWLQLENLTLHQQVEELQGQLRCQQLFQQNSIKLEAKIRTAVEEVKRSVLTYSEEWLAFTCTI